MHPIKPGQLWRDSKTGELVLIRKLYRRSAVIMDIWSCLAYHEAPWRDAYIRSGHRHTAHFWGKTLFDYYELISDV